MIIVTIKFPYTRLESILNVCDSHEFLLGEDDDDSTDDDGMCYTHVLIADAQQDDFMGTMNRLNVGIVVWTRHDIHI